VAALVLWVVSRVLLCSCYGVVGGCQGVAMFYWVVVAMVLRVIARVLL